MNSQQTPTRACVFTLLVLFLLISRTAAQDEFGDLLGRINTLRASKGLPAYDLNGALSSAAQSQSQWLIDNTCAIAHVHPDGSSPRSRALAAGYPTSDVSENIYCGSLATLDDAWIFWLNSGVHYAGLVNTRYKEIGIGIAHGGNGAGYTLVFGNPGGPAYVPPAPAGDSNGSASDAGGSPQQPAFVVGLDERGNIKHEIQPGDTLGDILLIYGYTWEELPALLELNQMSQDDFRTLEVGSVILIPPQAGTYTPTPGGEAPTGTPEAALPTTEPTAEASTPDAVVPTETALPPDPSPVMIAATANSVPQAAALLLPSATPTLLSAASPTAMEVALAATSEVTSKSATITPPGTSPWLVVGLVVQVGVLLGAGFEFIRRKRR